MDDILTQRAESVMALLREPGDPGLKLQASKRLRELRSDQQDVLSQDGRESFLLREMQREVDRFHATPDELESLDAAEPRSRPLCTCADTECPLKDGRLPVIVREAVRDGQPLREGIRRFRQNHIGDPLVLNDAEDALDDKVGRVMEGYDLVIISLSENTPIEELEQRRTDDADAEPDAATASSTDGAPPATTEDADV